MAKLAAVRIYVRRGLIERGNGKPGYDWHEGYSEKDDSGAVVFPWLTRRECQQEARANGLRAVFEETETA